jgi:putative OPT family oligopeptide transporter
MPTEPKPFEPFVPASETPPEFTIAPVVMGTLLGILFGASSVYLVLKVGLTVSASIPVAVLAFALFKSLSSILGLRSRSVLENNIAQTAGSAGESIAFGVGLVMPALLVLGYDIDVVRVMTVGVLGGLLGILMMIPLRRAFVVQKHGELKYPEGTACADVLIAGEKGGATAGTLLIGIVIGFVYQFAMLGFKMWTDVANKALFWTAGGKTVGLKGAAVGCEMSAPLLGVGYIIGPRIASIMVAGGVLAYLVISPMIVFFGDNLTAPLAPAKTSINAKSGLDEGLIQNMPLREIRNNYILYIGAGAVAAGGIISMFKALPVILSSVVAGLRDLSGTGASQAGSVPRTDRDMPMMVVILGSLGMVLAIAAAPQLGLGFSWVGLAGSLMILIFGFLFVTVSSRLTGEIGSSSNPISGMTVATLLLTCGILLVLSELDVITLGKGIKLLALTIAGVVCIACSNGGTTSQALKTGYLLGATPIKQQYAILIGSLASALVVGLVLIWMNQAGTIYTKRDLPKATVNVRMLMDSDTVKRGQYADDKKLYKVLIIGDREKVDPALIATGSTSDVPPGRYLIDEDGHFVYRCDPAVNGKLDYEDSEADKPEEDRKKSVRKFDAPKTQLVALIIDGILDRKLPWDLVFIGVLIAITLELSGVPALPFAVGVYLPLSSSTPIFLGGLIRWAVDKVRNRPDEGDSSPGVLLSSGYIAGGSIAAVIAAFMAFDTEFEDMLNFGKLIDEHVDRTLSSVGRTWPGGSFSESNFTVTIAFAAISLILFVLSWLTRRKGPPLI